MARESQIGSGVDDVLKALGDRLAAFLSRDGHAHSASPPTNQEFLKRCLRRGDVMLVEGTSIISTAIKYLTQSTWSHAALCIDEHLGDENHPEGGCMFVEADLQAGVRRVRTRSLLRVPLPHMQARRLVRKRGRSSHRLRDWTCRTRL